MSRSVNRIILVGHAGSEPDVRQTASGSTVAHVSLATNRTYNREGELQHRTDWHRLTFWNQSAEAIEKYLRKGNRLFVEGRIEYGSYDRDGVTVPTTDVIVQDFVFLDSRPAENEADTTEADLEELTV